MAGLITCTGAQGARVRVGLATLLTEAAREAVRAETIAWIKRLRLATYDNGLSMRERFTYRGDSLWWFTELYLQKTRQLETAIATVLALEAARERFEPAQILLEPASLTQLETARAFGRARGLAVTTLTRVRQPPQRWKSYLIGLSAALSRLRPRERHATPQRSATVAAFVHNAFWRDGQDGGRETYIGPVLDAVQARAGDRQLAYVGVGPRRNFTARRWWDPLVGTVSPPSRVTPIERLAPREALAGSLALWRDREALAALVTTGPDIRAAAVVRGCDLWPTLCRELGDAARLQWPWSARAMDEAGAAIDALAPAVVVTYAEAGGWGRALVLESRRRRVPAVGLQHGFIYRHWLNYLHEPDEIEPIGSSGGFPYPDRTLLFDAFAARHLTTAGHLPADSLRVTGSPRLDEMVARLGTLRERRDALRMSFGVSTHDRLLVLAAKFREIHAELPSLFAAVSRTSGVRLIVKPHPAETAEVYGRQADRSPQVTVVAADTDLTSLVAAADALVTRNSTVAIDGLVVGLPAVVIGQPTNLQPFVDAGIMVGASGDTVGAAIETVLYDREAREALLGRAREFADRQDMRADGRSAARAADEILQMAGLAR
jgi:hypothetical protein